MPLSSVFSSYSFTGRKPNLRSIRGKWSLEKCLISAAPNSNLKALVRLDLIHLIELRRRNVMGYCLNEFTFSPFNTAALKSTFFNASLAASTSTRLEFPITDRWESLLVESTYTSSRTVPFILRRSADLGYSTLDCKYLRPPSTETG